MSTNILQSATIKLSNVILRTTHSFKWLNIPTEVDEASSCAQLIHLKWVNIPTKINEDRSCAQLIIPVELIKKGDKVGLSEATLLTKLGVEPFSCGPAIISVYDNGSVVSPEALNLMKDDLTDKFTAGVSMVASLSLVFSYPTLAATFHMFVNAYKNVLAVAVISIASAENAAALASKEKEKKNEPVNEPDDDLGFSLFD
ncbi:60S acidic ribosomal protein P0-like [Asparagus officinalis]|uniref:60S acidic ribosomal protein P0-like n=1 Tax=Asparagus officinalis TaxID=4686 RepID=UPI00098E4BB6|nr:60S acidic ribosomal protein P0-like [Asparagus officinalis]